MIKYLIIDLDGTLVFSNEANFKAYEMAFHTFGIPLQRKQFESLMGMGFEDMLKSVAPDLNASDQLLLKERKASFYKQELHLIKKNEPLIQFLNSLKNHHSISIVTSASKKNAPSVLEYFQLKDWFDVMIFGDDVKHHKPNPEGYFLCLDKLNAKSDECLAFEDSSIGIEAAKQAGLQVLKIPCFL